MIIYHNPRCRKSRAGLQFLEEKGLDFTIRDYFKEPFTPGELETLLKKLGRVPLEMIRTQEEVYKKNWKGKELPDSEWIRIMTENPRLIRRPIVEHGEKAVFAQPPEEINKLL